MVSGIITAKESHRRMGHIDPEAAKRLITEGSIEGIILDDTIVIKNCASCIHAKTHWKAIHKIHREPRAAEFSNEIHSDLWGPLPVCTPGQKEYFASFTDNTHWSSVDLLRMKDGTFQSFKNFEAWAIHHHNINGFKILHTDRGGEYLDGEFTKYFALKGTKQKMAPHNTPEYNGVAEQLNCTLLEKTWAMLHSSGLLKNLWGEAIKHAVWLKNRTATKALPPRKTPYEMLYKKKLILVSLREWGTKVWVHDRSGTKLDGRVHAGGWVGFDEEGNAHCTYWPEKHSVTVKQSVKFDDNNVILPYSVMIEGEKGPINHSITQETHSASPEPEDLQNSGLPEEITKNPTFNQPYINSEHSGAQNEFLCVPFNRTTDGLTVN